MGAPTRIVMVSSVGVAVVVGSGASCAFEPQFTDGAIACGRDRTCPPGYVCASDERCYSPGGGPSTNGDGGGPDGSQSSGLGPFRIGGTVGGLVGKGLVLQDVGTDDLPVLTNGPFSFSTLLPSGALYNVSVSSQPSEPTQLCAVTNGMGSVKDADVTSVGVTCETEAFGVGGTVVGLNGRTGLVLANNGGDDLTIPPAGGLFTFAKKVASGASFDVTIRSQPATGGACDVSGGSGTMGVTDVTSVVVNCMPGTFTIGGTITGLVGTVVLQNNGASDLKLTANGTFAFALPLATGTPFAVTVKTEPTYPPRAQTCTVTNGTGSVGTTNITNVAVTCTTKTFTIGGSVTALNGIVTLTNNGGDDLAVNASGPFKFAGKIGSGSTYAVAVKKHPTGQLCNVTNGSGTVTNANITNVGVACISDLGILCGTGHCAPSTQVCCARGKNDNSDPSCHPKSTTCNPRYACDSTADCGATPGTICCGTLNPVGSLTSSSCLSFASCSGLGAGNYAVLCNTAAAGECANGGKCTKDTFPSPDFVKTGYSACK